MNFEENKKYLIITDSEYKFAILNSQSKNKLASVTIISKNELLDMVSFYYAQGENDPIPFLLQKEKYDYNEIKKILRILRFVYANYKDKSIQELKEIDASLKKDNKKGLPFLDTFISLKNGRRDSKGNKIDYLLYSDYGEIELSLYDEIYLFEEDEDFELLNLLKNKNIEYELLHFEDLGYENNYKDKQPKILSFENKFYQYLYIFSDIRKKLQENPSLQDKISILVHSSDDYFYLNYFQEVFSIPVISKIQTPFISNELVHQNLVAFKEKRNFNLIAFDEKDESLKVLVNIIDSYNLKSLSFDFAYACLMEILSTLAKNTLTNDSGIIATSQLDFKGRINYVTNFIHDDFYKEYDDNDVLSDADLKEIGVNPSYIKTRLDRRKKLNYILYSDISLLSFAQLHLNDNIYSSQFIDELNWKIVKGNAVNDDGVYSNKAKEIIFADYYDVNKIISADNYRDYSHTFTPIDINFEKQSYSPSVFKSYFECPFSYYLNSVLNVGKYDVDIDRVSMNIGNLIHKVLEKVYTNEKFDTDFEVGFNEAFNEGIKEYYDKATPDKRNDAFIEYIKHWLKDIVLYYRKNKTAIHETVAKEDGEKANIIDEVAEKGINFSLFDEDKNEYKIKGRLDKIIYTERNGVTYSTLIDYKTGNDKFELKEVFLGGSLQLPLYAYSLKLDEEKERKEKEEKKKRTDDIPTLASFGIQHVYYSSVPIKKETDEYSDESLKEKIRINSGEGITLKDDNYLDSLDPTTNKVSIGDKGERKSSRVNGEFLKISNAYQVSNDPKVNGRKPYPAYKLNDMYSDAINATINTIKNIKNKNFDIRPVSKHDPCKYCAFKDVCYHSLADERDIRNEIYDKFILNGKDD